MGSLVNPKCDQTYHRTNKEPLLIRFNEQVELHHKKQQSPAKPAAPKAASKESKEQKEEKVVKEDKTHQQSQSPQKKQQQQHQPHQQQQQQQQLQNGTVTKKDNAVTLSSPSPSAPSASTASTVISKKTSPQHETVGGRKERKVFSKKELRELINQIEQNELPPDIGEDIVQVELNSLISRQFKAEQC